MELTPDYHERTRVMAYSAFLANIAALLMPWIFKATELPFFEDGIQGGRVVGFVIAGVIMVTGALSAGEKITGHEVSRWHIEGKGWGHGVGP